MIELNLEIAKELARMNTNYQENIYPVLRVLMDAKAAM